MQFFLFYSSILILLVKCVSVNGDFSLCNSQKSKTQCYCMYEIDPRTNDPLYLMDCSRTELETFPTFKQIENVEQVDLSFNLIDKLDGSASSVENPLLISLKLSYNQIYYIGPYYFENFVNLEVLDLSHNKISTLVNSKVFDGLNKLKILDLSFNTISTLPEYIFYPLPKLEELYIGYNYLGETFTQVNNLFNSTIGLTKNITKLEMNGLDMKFVPNLFFEGGNYLTHLSMADNPLLEVPILPYSLTYLDLSGTWISVLAGKHLNYHSLKVLKLNRLQSLKKIDRYAFYSLQSLMELELNDNPKLRDLDSLAFGILSEDTEVHLKKLTLARCAIKTINETYQYLFDKLEYINLEGNPFTCDCNIFWLQDFEKSLQRKHNLRCLRPGRLRMKLIMDLTEEDLPKCESKENRKQKLVIAVLLLLIIFLIILVTYLFYLGPFYSENRYRGISPESPYSNVMEIQPNRIE